MKNATLEVETRTLRTEPAEVRLECCMLKNSGPLRESHKVRYRFMQGHPEYPVAKQERIL